MSVKSISILNMKGGVGKTTTTINLAIELAENFDKKVLVVDLDPQFNSTQSLFMYTYNNLDLYFQLLDDGKTISSILTNGQNGVTRSKSKRKKRVNQTTIVHDLTENLKILPGDLTLTVEANSGSYTKLKSYFKKHNITKDFDYVIFDCPPTWGIYTTLALDMSDYYLIPSKLDEFSTIGIDILTQKLEEYIYIKEESDALHCLGILYTMTNKTRSKKGISPEQYEIKKLVEDHFDDEMKQSLRSNVIPFEPVLQFFPKIAHKSAVYPEHEIPQLSIRIHDFAEEVVRRCENPEILMIEGE